MATKKEQEKRIKNQEAKIKKQSSIIRGLKREMGQIKKELKNNHDTKIKVLKNEVNSLKKNTRTQVVVLVTSAFGFTAALFWRDAIKSLFEQVFGIVLGSQGTWAYQFLVALSITVFAATVTYYLSKFK